MSEKQDAGPAVKEFLEPFNYLYFLFLFLGLASVQIYHVFVINASDRLVQDFYIVYALLESFVEVLLISWISLWILSNHWKKLHYVYLCAISTLFFCRLIDFALVRLMDLSVWYWIHVVFQETFSNFIEMLYAANIKLFTWFICFLSVAAAIGFSCFVFYLLDKFCRKKPFFLSSRKLFGSFILSLLLLVATDFLLYNLQSPQDALRFSKALPWKRTLFDSPEEILSLKAPLQGFQSGFSSIEKMDSDFFLIREKA